MKLKFNSLAAWLLASSLTTSFTTHAADVQQYLVAKGQDYRQTNGAAVLSFTNENPFRFMASVAATTTNSVTNVTVKLPNAQLRTLTNSDGEFQLEQGFSSKNALDTNYGPGNYVFTIQAVNDGTNKPTLNLAAENYPGLPKLANWPDLQAVEPALPLEVSWGAFTNGTTNDFIQVEVNTLTGENVATTPDLLSVAALNGTSNSVVMPANTLDYGVTYQGRLLFVKRTALALTNYPGASGVAAYFRETKFPLVTLPAPPVHGRIQFSVSSQSVAETAGVANLTLTRAGTQGVVTVDVQTFGGTATAGEDYESIFNTFRFEDGEATQTVSVTILDDYLLEGSETVNVRLLNPTEQAELGDRTNLVLTITDNELAAAGKLQFSATNYPVAESSSNVIVTVNRVGGSAGVVTGTFSVADITAQGLGVDYGTVGGTLIFSNGVTSRTISIPIVTDSIDETNETFRVRLTATGGGAALGTNINSTVTITDNDTGGAFAFKPATYAVAENATNFLVTVIRTGGTASGVTVDFETHRGSAIEEDDYVATNGTLVFGSNEVTKTFSVFINNDTLAEGNEFFTVQLTNATGGATISTTNIATLTIKDDESSVRFTNASYVVSEGVTNLLLNVIREGALITPVSVTFATADDSAHAGADYTATNGSLIFPTNTSVRSFRIPIRNNTIVDGARAFTVELSNPLNGLQLGNLSTTTVIINDNDAGGAIRFSTNNFAVTETGTNAVITLLRSGGLASGVTVRFNVEEGSAEAGADYSNVTQVVTFNAGETNKKVFIPIINDALVENPETVLLSLEDPTGGASLGSSNLTATLTITSDDVGGTINFLRTNFFAYENATNLYVIVTRTGGKASGVTVDYATQSGVASSGDDFAETSGTLTFAANETNKLITIPIVNDSLAEVNETFYITLSEVTGGATLAATNPIELIIVDDESSIGIGSNNYTVSEGATNLVVTLYRTGALLTPVSVDFSTVNDSAAAPGDFVATNVTVNFPSNVISKTILVRIVNDTIVEGGESFGLRLSNPQGGVQLNFLSNAVVNITDNDLGGEIRFSTNNFTVAENGTNASITLLRSGGLASGVTVHLKVEDGSAEVNADYSNATQTVTFNAGETNKKVFIPIINDTIVENPETIFLTLEDIAGGASPGSITAATLTITDNDLGGVISLVSTTLSASENGTNFSVNVKRTGGAASGVTVDYATHSGTATSGSDFSETDGTLTFGANETNKVILVPILNDTLAEGNESFTLVLSGVNGGATLNPTNTATLTIVDDESSISISNAVVSVSESGTNVIVTLVRSGALLTSVSVDFATVNGSATAGSDYVATNGTVVFPTNTPVKRIVIPIINDGVIENSETFKFSISNPQGGVQLGTTTNETVTIENDDFAGTVQFAAATFSGTEGSNAVVTITRTGGSAGGVSVYFQMVANSALPGLDYTNKSGYISFAPGQTTTNILVPLVADAIAESTETVSLLLNITLGGLALGTPSFATLNIADKPDPNAIPEVGAPFFSASVNGANIAGLALSATNFADNSGIGANSLANVSGSHLASPYSSFSLLNVVANNTGSVTLPSSTANGAITYTLVNGFIPDITTSADTGGGGTVKFDVINKTTKTVTGRFDVVTVSSTTGLTYHVVGSFRYHY
ncbi:MAG: hypothetical protein RL616_757 [Verrucomicrobiota bacterium]